MGDTKSRDITFDVMKGIGILLVLWGHVWQMSSTSGHVISSFHMPLFFIVAGCFSKSWNELGTISVLEIIKKYFIRLYLPVLFSIGVLALWFLVKSINNPIFINNLITTLLSGVWASTSPLKTPWGDVSLGAVWFLLALFWAKSIFLIVSRTKIYSGLVCLILSYASYELGKVFPLVPFCLLQGCLALPFVWIGWFCRTYNKKFPIVIVFALIVIWLLSIKYAWMDMYELRMDKYLLNLVGACGGTLFVYYISLFLSKYTNFVSKFMAYLGFCSLSILCWHSVDIGGSIIHQILSITHVSLPIWSEYIVRYLLTILLAIASVNIPYLKKIFV